ncbi:MAG: nitroreductase family protein [Acidobacteriota bacterium]
MSEYEFEPLSSYSEHQPEEMLQRASGFLEVMKRRRTVRQIADRDVDRRVIESCVEAAMTAPSGANMQPWHFVVVQSSEVKREIRRAAEEVEREFYGGRASDEWLEALAPLGTDEHKPFLETAPFLIVIFAQLHGTSDTGDVVKHYYVNESVGIATGILITALHLAGLVSLTHTPSPMRFLNQLLGRPKNERPFLILAVGYPDSDARVPRIDKKSLAQSCEFL